ncbi:MAG: cache domain-containing protein [Bacteroidales bacterium]|nr:cache domain-containing protein [Bacteroidales bacterium]
MNIRTKIPLYTGVTVLVTMLVVTVFSILEYRSRTLESIESYRNEQTDIIKNQLKDHVNNAYKILNKSYSEIKNRYQLNSVKIKDYPVELRQAIRDIEQISFGDAGYIWLNEVNPPYTVIMHPIKPEMNGTVQVFYIKDTQQNVYEAFADVIIANKGEGFLGYDYYKPGTNERIPKLSFIKLFEPYGWVIGTGVYVDYIDKMVARKTEELNKQTSKMIKIILILGFVLIALATVTLFYLGKTITDAIYSVQQKLFHMSKGHIIEPDKTERSDEIGDMNKSLSELIAGVNTYSEFASNIEKGNLDAGFKPLSDKDNLGISLLDMRESLKAAKEEEQKRAEENERRNYANEGYAMFSELMRKGSEDIRELSYAVIGNLVSYVKGIQGGIFILNDENKEDVFLELTASIAYNRRKFKEKKIKIGDGLIGACAYEKEKIYITNIPDDYAEIRSGLGTANPKSILIIPLLMEDNLIGIIELASLDIIDEFDIEFVEKVSESIAASLYAAKISTKTSLLQKEYNELLKEKENYSETLIAKEKEIKMLRRKLTTLKEEKSILSIK